MVFELLPIGGLKWLFEISMSQGKAQEPPERVSPQKQVAKGHCGVDAEHKRKVPIKRDSSLRSE
ncbi:MAG: hypothetical protein DMG34_19580 [Acidobacteria bacterium]|nr:MAG: hypothetical protein DMG34_19580 [Acidobacteriota bacterium]